MKYQGNPLATWRDLDQLASKRDLDVLLIDFNTVLIILEVMVRDHPEALRMITKMRERYDKTAKNIFNKRKEVKYEGSYTEPSGGG